MGGFSQFVGQWQSTKGPRWPAVALVLLALALLATSLLAGNAAASNAALRAELAGQATQAAHAAATARVPTPTPAPIVPRVLAVLQPPVTLSVACNSTCYSVAFTADGPFTLVATCQPFQYFADSLPTYTLLLLDANGHVLDTLVETCGDPNNAAPTTKVVPEQRAAGTYTLTLQPSAGYPISVLVLNTLPSSE